MIKLLIPPPASATASAAPAAASAASTTAAITATAAVGAPAAASPVVSTRAGPAYGYLPVVEHFTVQAIYGCLTRGQQRHFYKCESLGLAAVFVLYDVYRRHFSERREFIP